MKKTLSFILAVMMLLGCMSITAFAAENEATITAKIKTAGFEYEMVIPTATTLTEANHENVLLGTDGKVSIKDIKHPTDKVNVVYTVDLTNGTLTDGTNTINATYKYKQGDAAFAAIDGTTKVTVYANKTINDSLVNVTANSAQWDAAPAGTYNASVTFNFATATPMVLVKFCDFGGDWYCKDGSGQKITQAEVPLGTTWELNTTTNTLIFSNGLQVTPNYNAYPPYFFDKEHGMGVDGATSGTLTSAWTEFYFNGR